MGMVQEMLYREIFKFSILRTAKWLPSRELTYPHTYPTNFGQEPLIFPAFWDGILWPPPLVKNRGPPPIPKEGDEDGDSNGWRACHDGRVVYILYFKWSFFSMYSSWGVLQKTLENSWSFLKVKGSLLKKVNRFTQYDCEPGFCLLPNFQVWINYSTTARTVGTMREVSQKLSVPEIYPPWNQQFAPENRGPLEISEIPNLETTICSGFCCSFQVAPWIHW